MAIYKVTDTKTGTTSVQVDLEEVYEDFVAGLNEGDTTPEQEAFALDFATNDTAQRYAGVHVEKLDSIAALEQTKEEYKAAQKKLHDLKPLINSLADEAICDDSVDLDKALKFSISTLTKIQERVNKGELKLSDKRKKKLMEKKPKASGSSSSSSK